MVAAGQVYIRPEHVAFRRQASVFSASYLKAGGGCDVVDAGMGALTACADRARSSEGDDEWFAAQFVRGYGDERLPDDEIRDLEDWTDWRAPAWLFELDGYA